MNNCIGNFICIRLVMDLSSLLEQESISSSITRHFTILDLFHLCHTCKLFYYFPYSHCQLIDIIKNTYKNNPVYDVIEIFLLKLPYLSDRKSDTNFILRVDKLIPLLSDFFRIKNNVNYLLAQVLSGNCRYVYMDIENICIDLGFLYKYLVINENETRIITIRINTIKISNKKNNYKFAFITLTCITTSNRIKRIIEQLEIDKQTLDKLFLVCIFHNVDICVHTKNIGRICVGRSLFKDELYDIRTTPLSV